MVVTVSVLVVVLTMVVGTVDVTVETLVVILVTVVGTVVETVDVTVRLGAVAQPAKYPPIIPTAKATPAEIPILAAVDKASLRVIFLTSFPRSRLISKLLQI